MNMRRRKQPSETEPDPPQEVIDQVIEDEAELYRAVFHTTQKSLMSMAEARGIIRANRMKSVMNKARKRMRERGQQ